MGKSGPFFRATREQLKALVLLTLLLLSVVFWPAIQWAASSAARRSLVRTDQVETVVPRLWIAVEKGSGVQAWKPRLTLFCSSPRSSMEIRVEETLVGKEDAWLARAQLIFRERGFSNPATRAFSSPAGNVQCLKSTSEIRPSILESACFASKSGLVASFDGAASELRDFYSVVASANAVRGR